MYIIRILNYLRGTGQVVEVSFISRFRLRPLMGTRQERPGMYLSNYLVCPEIMVKQNN